jgi:hypothetical protein
VIKADATQGVFEREAEHRHPLAGDVETDVEDRLECLDYL